MGEERVGFPSDFFLLLFLLPCSEKKNVNEEEYVYMVCCSHLQEVEAAKEKKSCKNRLFLITC